MSTADLLTFIAGPFAKELRALTRADLAAATAPLEARIAQIEATMTALGAAVTASQNTKDVAALGAASGPFDAELVFVEGTGFVLRLTNGSRVKDLVLPVPFYVDVFRVGERYVKGSIVTHRGLWLATADTRERPGDGATAWKLILKSPRDGRAGRDAR